MSKSNIFNLIILDESGSMQTIEQPIIDSFNEIVQTIRSAERRYPEQKHFVTFVTFNGDGIKTQFYNYPVKTIKKINRNTYRPNSSTPLFDAIGQSCTRLRYDLPLDEDNNVLVTILTDGYENASREYSGLHINQLVSELRDQGWIFNYIGTDHDVQGQATSINIINNISFDKSSRGISNFLTAEKHARSRHYEKIHKKENIISDDYYKGDNAEK